MPFPRPAASASRRASGFACSSAPGCEPRPCPPGVRDLRTSVEVRVGERIHPLRAVESCSCDASDAGSVAAPCRPRRRPLLLWVRDLAHSSCHDTRARTLRTPVRPLSIATRRQSVPRGSAETGSRALGLCVSQDDAQLGPAARCTSRTTRRRQGRSTSSAEGTDGLDDEPPSDPRIVGPGVADLLRDHTWRQRPNEPTTDSPPMQSLRSSAPSRSVATSPSTRGNGRWCSASQPIRGGSWSASAQQAQARPQP